MVTTDQSQCPSDSTIEVRGTFTACDSKVWVLRTIGDPGGTSSSPATSVRLRAQVQIHDFARGALLASKTIEDEYFLATPSNAGGRLTMVSLSEEKTVRRLSRGVASGVKDVVSAYLKTAKRG